MLARISFHFIHRQDDELTDTQKTLSRTRFGVLALSLLHYGSWELDRNELQ